jgi:hypothetical protein
MSLPILDTQPTYSTHLPVLNMEVKYKPYTIGQEKKFIIAIENENAEELYINLKELLKSCVQEPVDFETISMYDFMKLVYAVRAVSKSEALTLGTKCSKCSKDFSIILSNLEDALKIKNKNKLTNIVKVSDKLSFEIKPVDAVYLKDFFEMMQLYNKEDKTEYINLAIKSIAYNIKKVIYTEKNKEKIYTDFTVDDLDRKIIEHLTEAQVQKIKDATKDIINMYFEMLATCTHCGHEEVTTEENFFALL